MANETTTSTLDDTLFTSWITRVIQNEARPNRVSKPLFAYKGRMPTKRYDWPTQTDPGEASDITTETEASIANTALSTGVASATAAIDGQGTAVSDFVVRTSVADVENHVRSVLARSVYEAEENEAAVNYGNFSNTVGTSGSDLTAAQFNSGVSTLEQNDADGPLVAVLHPVQSGDLRGSMQATANAHFYANPQLNQTISQDLSSPGGYVGDWLQVDIYHTSAVPTANTAADRAGAIFTRGSGDGDFGALGWYEVWDLIVESHRLPDQPGTKMVATSCRGTTEILDRRGVSIITDA